MKLLSGATSANVGKIPNDSSSSCKIFPLLKIQPNGFVDKKCCTSTRCKSMFNIIYLVVAKTVSDTAGIQLDTKRRHFFFWGSYLPEVGIPSSVC